MNDDLRHVTCVGRASGFAFLLLILFAITFSFARAVALPVPDTATPNQNPPPTPRPTPAEDTKRYVEWLAQKGRAIEGKPREYVTLRVGDWRFFEQRSGPWQFGDRAVLDHSGHVVIPSEQGEWYALLGTSGLDAGGALERVAWLLGACGVDPRSEAPEIAKHYQITAPTLTNTTDGTIFQGWLFFSCMMDPPNTHHPSRITITATANATKIVTDPPTKP